MPAENLPCSQCVLAQCDLTWELLHGTHISLMTFVLKIDHVNVETFYCLPKINEKSLWAHTQ